MLTHAHKTASHELHWDTFVIQRPPACLGVMETPQHRLLPYLFHHSRALLQTQTRGLAPSPEAEPPRGRCILSAWLSGSQLRSGFSSSLSVPPLALLGLFLRVSSYLLGCMVVLEGVLREPSEDTTPKHLPLQGPRRETLRLVLTFMENVISQAGKRWGRYKSGCDFLLGHSSSVIFTRLLISRLVMWVG